jgi:hypothetical protein
MRKFLVVGLLLGPPVIIVLVTGWFWRPQILRDWAIVVVSALAGWAAFLAAMAQITGRTLIDLWNPLQDFESRHPADTEPPPEQLQGEPERHAQNLHESGRYFDEGNCQSEAIQSRYLAARAIDIGGNSTHAKDLFQKVGAEASKTGHAMVARNCCLAIADIECEECERDETNKVISGALTVMSTIVPSGDCARAASICADARQRSKNLQAALSFRRVAAEEYELVAEQELLARSLREHALDSETVLYLDARNRWRALVFSAPASLSKTELTQAQRARQRAFEAWRAAARFAGDISDAELGEVELLYFQTKEYRFALARLHSDPTDYELAQANAYYKLASREWEMLQQLAGIQLGSLREKGYLPGDPSYDAVAKMQIYGQRRVEAVRKAKKNIESDINSFPVEGESEPRAKEEQRDAQTDLRPS